MIVCWVLHIRRRKPSSGDKTVGLARGRHGGRRQSSFAAVACRDGITSHKVSNFADGTCLRAMALAYDSCFDLLTLEDKTAIAIRADRMFASWRNNLETRIFSAHIWQHILHEFAEAADQNSFNILFGGKRVFANSGYYIGYGDDHFKGWYMYSRGHNTVLIDNKGQLSGTPDGYGQVVLAVNGDPYTLGSGSD